MASGDFVHWRRALSPHRRVQQPAEFCGAIARLYQSVTVSQNSWRQFSRYELDLGTRDEMSSVIRLDFSVGPFFFLTAHATLGEDTILTRAATITTSNRGIPRGEHTYLTIGARSCACDGTCAVRCPEL